MERPPLPPPPKQQLNCPRCDSSNTKFCYYNNYSLSQPRHFCKACKRYWTRGGTLRNVPVGGGCRKNKRVKKPSPPTSSAVTTDPPLPTPTQIDVRSADPNPLFYGGLSYNYTIQPPPPQPQQFDGLGLGFHPTEFSSHLPQFAQFPAVMSSSHEYPIAKQASDYIHFDSVNGNLGFLKDVKMEGWKLPCDQNPPEAIASATAPAAAATADTVAASDSSFLYWNPTMSNSWPDLNYGSSMAPLI